MRQIVTVRLSPNNRHDRSISFKIPWPTNLFLTILNSLRRLRDLVSCNGNTQQLKNARGCNPSHLPEDRPLFRVIEGISSVDVAELYGLLGQGILHHVRRLLLRVHLGTRPDCERT